MRCSLSWVDPLDAAESLTRDQQTWILLYSGQHLDYTGRYSLLAIHPREIVSTGGLKALEERLSDGDGTFDQAWFGYLGYELLQELEPIISTKEGYISLPDLWFTRFGMVLVFDHELQAITCHSSYPVPFAWPPAPAPGYSAHVKVEALEAVISKGDYLASVTRTREAIARGEFYQANITRKFTGSFAAKPDPLVLFRALCRASPAAYSACLRMDEASVLSSSPERFLTLDGQGLLQTRPIKGTAARRQDPLADAQAKAALASSEKDRAENLMIVDLMRNDFARICEPGSVKVNGLFEVSTYAALHHMASSVQGQKRKNVSALDAVKACFPPGSMTGAPKIRAMEWCMEQEPMRRGVYSGALGWFGGDGSCDLSVVIRTLVVEGRRFEFQVGGGIVSDSDPEAEWRETMVKARGICQALGVEMEELEKI